MDAALTERVEMSRRSFFVSVQRKEGGEFRTLKSRYSRRCEAMIDAESRVFCGFLARVIDPSGEVLMTPAERRPDGERGMDSERMELVWRAGRGWKDGRYEVGRWERTGEPYDADDSPREWEYQRRGR